MSYRKKTMRKMYPVARKLARLENSLDGISRKIKNLIPQVEKVEFDARALRNAKAQGKLELPRQGDA